ncbi:MAG: hypothetical protein AB7K24_28995, partial [Gemmataceae bacterium]
MIAGRTSTRFRQLAAGWLACLACAAWPGAGQLAAQTDEPASQTTAELLEQMRQLRNEVDELRRSTCAPAAPAGLQQTALQVEDVLPAAPGDVPMGLLPEDTADPQSGLPGGEGPLVPGSGDNFPMRVSYRYNGGGGYTSLSTPDGEYSVNLQNLVAFDGTFYDKANIATPVKGFNLPFSRNYLFGNITRDWDYQIAFQESLGSFNVLDMWANYRHSDQFNIRFGRKV